MTCSVFVVPCLFIHIHVCAGLSEWEDDRVLAAVLAASQQEYIDNFKRSASRLTDHQK